MTAIPKGLNNIQTVIRQLDEEKKVYYFLHSKIEEPSGD